MTLHINEVKLQGEDPFAKQFNLCSDLFLKVLDDKLKVQDRKQAFKEWLEQRQRLELGMY